MTWTPNLAVSTLKSLATTVLKQSPGISTRELYDRVSRTPEVQKFREARAPGYTTARVEKHYVPRIRQMSRSEKSEGNTAVEERSIPPTRKFFKTKVLDQLERNKIVTKTHKLYKPSPEEVALLPRHFMVAHQKKWGNKAVRLEKWTWELTPPTPTVVVPKPPKNLSLNSTTELELRRKAGEFDHLNRRKKRLVMRRSMLEIEERQKEERKEWNDAATQAKEDDKLGLYDPKGWLKGGGVYGKALPPAAAPENDAKGLWALEDADATPSASSAPR